MRGRYQHRRPNQSIYYRHMYLIRSRCILFRYTPRKSYIFISYHHAAHKLITAVYLFEARRNYRKWKVVCWELENHVWSVGHCGQSLHKPSYEGYHRKLPATQDLSALLLHNPSRSLSLSNLKELAGPEIQLMGQGVLLSLKARLWDWQKTLAAVGFFSPIFNFCVHVQFAVSFNPWAKSVWCQ